MSEWIVPPMCEEEPHDCLEHLIPQSHEWTEPHGELCYQEWYECVICGDEFTERELDILLELAYP